MSCAFSALSASFQMRNRRILVFYARCRLEICRPLAFPGTFGVSPGLVGDAQSNMLCLFTQYSSDVATRRQWPIFPLSESEFTETVLALEVVERKFGVYFMGAVNIRMRKGVADLVHRFVHDSRSWVGWMCQLGDDGGGDGNGGSDLGCASGD